MVEALLRRLGEFGEQHQTRMAEVQRREASLEAQLDAATASVEQAIARASASSDAARAQEARLAAAATALEERLASAAALEERLAASVSAAAALESRLASTTESLEARLAATTQAMEAATARASEAGAAAASAEKQVESLRRRLEQLQPDGRSPLPAEAPQPAAALLHYAAAEDTEYKLASRPVAPAGAASAFSPGGELGSPAAVEQISTPLWGAKYAASESPLPAAGVAPGSGDQVSDAALRLSDARKRANALLAAAKERERLATGGQAARLASGSAGRGMSAAAFADDLEGRPIFSRNNPIAQLDMDMAG